jgi:hypothetical protein
LKKQKEMNPKKQAYCSPDHGIKGMILVIYDTFCADKCYEIKFVDKQQTKKQAPILKIEADFLLCLVPEFELGTVVDIVIIESDDTDDVWETTLHDAFKYKMITPVFASTKSKQEDVKKTC